MLASGAVDLVLAAVLLLLSAVGSAILIGIVVGVDLILAGVALLLIHRQGLDKDGAALADPALDGDDMAVIARVRSKR